MAFINEVVNPDGSVGLCIELGDIPIRLAPGDEGAFRVLITQEVSEFAFNALLTALSDGLLATVCARLWSGMMAADNSTIESDCFTICFFIMAVK